MPKTCDKCNASDPFFKYKLRNAAVRELGFKTYGDYRASDIWKTIRAMVLKRDGGKCVCCQKTATNVHHQSYAAAVLAGSALQLLHSLCRDCHKAIEFDEYGRKVTIAIANRVLRRALRRGVSPRQVTRQGAGPRPNLPVIA